MTLPPLSTWVRASRTLLLLLLVPAACKRDDYAVSYRIDASVAVEAGEPLTELVFPTLLDLERDATEAEYARGSVLPDVPDDEIIAVRATLVASISYQSHNANDVIVDEGALEPDSGTVWLEGPGAPRVQVAAWAERDDGTWGWLSAGDPAFAGTPLADPVDVRDHYLSGAASWVFEVDAAAFSEDTTFLAGPGFVVEVPHEYEPQRDPFGCEGTPIDIDI